ncbi:hypothetical protein APHAL10511_006858 [Amanita phalloides]|nr:hypothetical protein APHAL10511_006858 [Amanita phalloides]
MSTFLVSLIFAAWTWARCSLAHLQGNFIGNGTVILNERANLIANWGMARDLEYLGPQKRSSPEYEPHQPNLLPTSVPLEFQKTRKDFYWLAPVEIGTPARALKLMVHTDFYIFWAKYTSDESKRGKYHHLQYINSPEFAGFEYLDRIKLGEINGNVRFIAATWAKGLKCDGVLGLQLKNEEGGLPGIVPYFLSKEAKPHPVFALYLGLTGSQLHIGGPHAHYYRDRIEYHGVSKFPRYAAFWRWQIAGGSIHVNGRKNVVSGITTGFDSSTRFIYGPASLVGEIYKELQLEGHSNAPTKHTFPCNLKPVIKFQWNNGNEWVLSPGEFNLGPVHVGSKLCKGVIKGDDFDDGWSFGTSFFKSVYTVFEMDQKNENHRMGFAELPPPPPIDGISH